MIWQASPFIIPLVISALFMGLLALIAWKHRNLPGVWQVLLFLSAATLWSCAYALEMASADLASNLLFTCFEYPGIVVAPVAWFLFVLHYTGRERWISKTSLSLLFIIPALTLMFVLTNGFHHLYYSMITPVAVGTSVIWVFSYGPLFWIHGVYSYLLVLGGIVLMVGKYRISHPIYRTQIALLLLALIAPFTANLLYVFHLGPVPGFDITPLAFLVTGTALVIATVRYQLFSVMPVAHSMLIEHLHEGIVVLNNRDIIVAMNTAASQMFGVAATAAVGKPKSSVLPDLQLPPGLAEAAGDQELELSRDGLRKNIALQRLPLRTGDGTLIGQIITVRDITEQKASALALQAANMKLNLLNDITRHDIRNKLTVLLVYLDCAKETKDPVEMQSLLGKINDAAEMISNQIEFTHAYQDLGVKSPLWQNFNDVVERVIPQIDCHGISIGRDLQGWELFADPLFERVVYNLIENAVKFGTTLTLIRISAREVTTGLLVTFEDNGVGIPGTDKEKVFSRGYGTNTGLGLFLAREILEITGITIQETGESGKGARFELVVPKGKYRQASP